MRLAAAALAAALAAPSAPAVPAPPPSAVRPVTEALHGVEIADPYRWLEDQESPETRAWIRAQETHFRSVIEPLPQRRGLPGLLEPYFRRDVVGVPWARGERLIFTRRLADEELPSIVVRLKGRDRVLVDPSTIDPSGKRSVEVSTVSDDGAVVAVAVRAGGADESEVRFLDADTGREVAPRLPSARYFSVALAPDGSVLHVRRDGDRTALRHRRPGASDEGEVLFGAGLPAKSGVGVDVTPDGWIVATTWHGSAPTKSDVHVRRLSESGPLRAVVDDVEARFDPVAGGGTLWVRTTWNAPHGRILAIDPANPSRDSWREVVPEHAEPLQDVRVAAGRICARYLRDVQPLVRVYRPDGTLERVLEPETIGSMGNLLSYWLRKSKVPTDIPATVATRRVGSSRVDLQACKLEYSIVSPK